MAEKKMKIGVFHLIIFFSTIFLSYLLLTTELIHSRSKTGKLFADETHGSEWFQPYAAPPSAWLPLAGRFFYTVPVRNSVRSDEERFRKWQDSPAS